MSHAPDTPPATAATDSRSSLVTWIGLAVIAAVALFYTLVPRDPNANADASRALAHPAVGVPFPEFAVEPLTGGGQRVRTSDLAGKVVLVDMWGPWCGSCVQEFPHLAEIANGYRQRDDFRLLAVAYGDNSPSYSAERLRDESAAFLRQRGLDVPVYFDPHDRMYKVAIQVGVFKGGLPTSFLLDRRGVVRAVWNGYTPGTERQMQQVVALLLAEKR